MTSRSLPAATCALAALLAAVELGVFDALAEGAPSGAGADAPAALAHHLFVELGFTGNRDHYTDPENSYLDAVLDRRLGIPITLSVLMMEVGRRLDVPLRGVGMPGHFLVGGGPGEWFDPFNRGERLDLNGCAARFAETQNAAAFRPQHLSPVPVTAQVNRSPVDIARTGAPRLTPVVASPASSP